MCCCCPVTAHVECVSNGNELAEPHRAHYMQYYVCRFEVCRICVHIGEVTKLGVLRKSVCSRLSAKCYM